MSSGLAALRAKVEKAAEGGGDFKKSVWFQLKKSGDSAKVRFLQEIDADSVNYDPDRGLLKHVAEISDPANYKNKCESTLATEGKCFGTEKHLELKGTDGYTGGWRPKERVYVNVLVYPEDGTDPYVAILSQGVSGKSITPTLLEYAEESITNKVFKIKRTGDGFNNTSYSLILLSEDKTPFDFTDIELYDLSNIPRQVPYAEQAAFFAADAAPAADSSSNTEW